MSQELVTETRGALFVSDDEAERRLTHNNNFARVEKLYRGGKSFKPNIPDEMRPLIGAVTREIGPKAAAEEFGISAMQASTLAKGQSSPGNINPDLRERVDALSNTVRESVMDKLAEALGMVDVSEAKDFKLKDKVNLVGQLATVVDRLNPRGKEGASIVAGFIVYAPPPLDSSTHEFPTITLPPTKT